MVMQMLCPDAPGLTLVANIAVKETPMKLHMAAYPAIRPATDEDTPPLVQAVALNADNLTTIMESPE